MSIDHRNPKGDTPSDLRAIHEAVCHAIFWLRKRGLDGEQIAEFFRLVADDQESKVEHDD